MSKYSKTLSAGARLYYLDVREDRKGTRYLTVTELNARSRKRHSIYIYPEVLKSFILEITEAAANVSKR